MFRLGNCFPPHITQQQKTLGVTKTKKREKNAQNTLDTWPKKHKPRQNIQNFLGLYGVGGFRDKKGLNQKR